MDNIIFEENGAVGILTLSRPKQLNALNRQVLEELGETLDALMDGETTRCLIITGSGEKAFVAGADIAEMAEMDEQQAREFSVFGSDVFCEIESLAIPVIAAVNGLALGGGCELTLCCDITLAAEHAVFSQPEVALGITPGWGGTQRLARRIGASRAKRMIFTGDKVKAPEALAIGLVDQVVDGAVLMDTALELARKIAAQPRGALAAAKTAINYGCRHGLDDGLDAETDLFGTCFASEEQKQALRAFLESRRK
jgi:enoyl-CoA hydratase